MIEKETRARLRELSEAAPSQTGILTAALKAIEEKKDLAGAVITFKRRTSGDMGLSEPFYGPLKVPCCSGLYWQVIRPDPRPLHRCLFGGGLPRPR